MIDKSWILNPKAIQAAKLCIQLVDQELGVKLKLSHPNFLDLLYDYCELTDSEKLTKAFKVLIAMAGAEVKNELIKAHSQTTKVTPIHTHQHSNRETEGEFLEQSLSTEHVEEFVEYKGKSYPRWQDKLEFKGLYRGQPRYA